jgi:hypothetical protein
MTRRSVPRELAPIGKIVRERHSLLGAFLLAVYNRAMNPSRFGPRAVAAAIFSSACPCPALPGDALADRIVIASSTWANLNGNTVGMTVEPGEINEAAGPAGAQDQSVWYEWTAPDTGTALWGSDGRFNSPMVHGLAAYTLTPGDEPLAMSRLIPEGACVQPSATKGRGVRIRVTQGQKLILRVWTAPGPTGSSAGAGYDLRLSFDDATQREPGDIPSTARSLAPYTASSNGPTAVFRNVDTAVSHRFSAEAADALIGGAWYPTGCGQWFEWVAPRTESFRFSLIESESAYATVLVAQQAGSVLSFIASTGRSATFAAMEGQRYLVRIGLQPPYPFSTRELRLQGGPAEDGDEPWTAVPLSSGSARSFMLHGASPTRLPLPNENAAGLPDVWFDLGSALAGAFKVETGYPHEDVMIYRTDAAGNVLNPVSGARYAGGQSFLAETGRRYLARVAATYLQLEPRRSIVSLRSGPPPPANDRRDGAILLPTDGPVLIYGDATGATTEESDRELPTKTPLGPTVWYALDRPATAQPWFARAWDHGEADVSIFREEDGTLVSAELAGFPAGRFMLTGSRTWIMISGEDDARFMLMAGPAVTSGDEIDDAVPLTPGPAQFLYAGAATANSPGPDFTEDEPTMWLSWTAEQSGLVLFSTRGSSSLQLKSSIFTAALDSVAASSWPPAGYERYGHIKSFRAVAGTGYRIRLHGFLHGPVVVRLKPGGWESPYDVWTQSYPAWQNVPSFADPEGDVDADGIANLMEMACLNTRGPLTPDEPGFPGLPETGPLAELKVQWEEQTHALFGPEGCVPFKLTGEASTDLASWEPVHEESAPGPPFRLREWLVYPWADFPAKYFRLRVHR